MFSMSKIEDPSGIPEDDFMREGLIDRLAQYVQAEPGAWHVRYNLGVALMHDNRLEEALEQFRLVLQQSPKHLETMVNIGGIHLSRGEADDALPVLTKALSVWDVPVVHANLAVAYLQKDRIEEAVRHMNRALELNPHLPDVLTNLGSAYIRLDRLAEAEEVSRKAVEMDPRFAMAHNNLAVILADTDRMDEAREYASKALELGYQVHPQLLAKLGLDKS
jgi:tetratricopeptide (TPR) repeat protein